MLNLLQKHLSQIELDVQMLEEMIQFIKFEECDGREIRFLGEQNGQIKDA